MYLKHLLHDRLDGGREHLLLRGEGAEDVVVLVGPVELLVRHSDAVVGGLRVDDVQVARRLFPVGSLYIVEASIHSIRIVQGTRTQ